MDLFQVVFNAINPYILSILKMALWITLISCAIKIIRSRSGNGGMGQGMNNPYSGVVPPIIGYLFGKGIPIIIGIIDVVCNDILRNMGR